VVVTGLASLVAVAALGPDGAAVASDRSWTPPVILGRGSSVALATSHGTTTIAWARGRFDKDVPLYMRRRVNGRAWGRAIPLSSAPGRRLAVAANRSNLTVAAWWQGPIRDRRLVVTRRQPGRSWERPVVLPRRVHRIHSNPQVAVSATGATVLWWTEIVEGDCDLTWSFVTYATPAGVWDEPHQLWPASCRWASQPDVAIGRAGNVNVVFPTRAGIRFTRRVAGHGWTAAHVIAPGYSRGPRLARTAGGDELVVAWDTADERTTRYETRRRLHGRWGPVRVARKLLNGLVGTEWDLVMDARGNATLGWLDEDGGVQVTRWPRRGPIGAECTLVESDDSRSPEVAELDLDAGAGGDTVVVGFPYAGGMRTILRPRGGHWREQPMLPGPTGRAGVQFAMRPDGDLDVAWQDDSFTGVIRYSRLTARSDGTPLLATTGR
jgi:hypothetical protein